MSDPSLPEPAAADTSPLWPDGPSAAGPADERRELDAITGAHLGKLEARVAWLGAREMVLLWSLWLLGCWTVIWSTTSLQAGPRLMLICVLIGLMWLWPAFRLSHGWVAWVRLWPLNRRTAPEATRIADRAARRAERYAPAAAWLEWLILLVVAQAVIWPLRLIGGWGYDQTLWLTMGLIAWSSLATTLVAWAACGARPVRESSRRWWAMLGCLAIVLASPALDVLGLDAGLGLDSPYASPLPMAWELGLGQADAFVPRWDDSIIAVLLIGAAGLAVTLTMTLFRPDPPDER